MKKNDNEYIINGEITTFYINKRDGRKYEVYIDTDDLQQVLALQLRWNVGYNNRYDTYYAKSSRYMGMVNGKLKYKTVYLHRVIANAQTRSDYVDHINHNNLDNRKENLRVTINNKNLKNRSSKNVNNKSGYRNVAFIEGKFVVQLQIQGKNTILGKFDDVHEAGAFAEQMRTLHYGEFAGKS